MEILFGFGILLGIVWIGGELAARAGFMAEDHDLLKEERERVKKQIELREEQKRLNKHTRL